MRNVSMSGMKRDTWFPSRLPKTTLDNRGHQRARRPLRRSSAFAMRAFFFLERVKSHLFRTTTQPIRMVSVLGIVGVNLQFFRRGSECPKPSGAAYERPFAMT
jgi:hypothetical protein